MSVFRSRILNRHGYYLEVQNDGTLTVSTKADSLNGILEFKTVDFGKITIKGEQAGLYIYAKSDGSLATTKTNKNSSSIAWEENKPKPNYTSFCSVATGGYLSIRMNRKLRAVKKPASQLGKSDLWVFQSI